MNRDARAFAEVRENAVAAVAEACHLTAVAWRADPTVRQSKRLARKTADRVRRIGLAVKLRARTSQAEG